LPIDFADLRDIPFLFPGHFYSRPPNNSVLENLLPEGGLHMDQELILPDIAPTFILASIKITHCGKNLIYWLISLILMLLWIFAVV